MHEHQHFLNSYIPPYLSSTLFASTLSCMSLSVLTKLVHVTDNPFPCSHSFKISFTIAFASPRYFASMMCTKFPKLSSSSRIPNSVYLVPTSVSMLRRTNSGSVGVAVRKMKKISEKLTVSLFYSISRSLLLAVCEGRKTFSWS